MSSCLRSLLMNVIASSLLAANHSLLRPAASFGWIVEAAGDLRGHSAFLAAGTESLSAEIQNVLISSHKVSK